MYALDLQKIMKPKIRTAVIHRDDLTNKDANAKV